MAEKRKYDSTVARIAGNIAGTFLTLVGNVPDGEATITVARASVHLARAIVAETERTEPKAE